MQFGMVEDPVTLKERASVATQCVQDLELPMPALLDKLDDAVNQAYRGWPDRLFLVGTDGKIKYSGGRGPFFFAPEAWAAAIEKTVESARSKNSLKPAAGDKRGADNGR